MPPKKNKKPSKNGYWQYVMECRDKSNRHMSKDELQTYCSQKWANMNKEERQPYEQRAQIERGLYQPTRYTTDGLEIDEVERQERDKVRRNISMKEDINKILKSAHYAQTLEDLVYLIVHVNHLVHYPAQDKYFVCEVAMAAVSLKNGVEGVLHEVVKPGKLPLGFFGPARAHSKETHQMIELVQEEPFEDNTLEVFTSIVNFMKPYAAGNKLPILYCDEKTFEMTNNVFANWRHEFGFDKEIVIYDFGYLLYALRNMAAQTQFWANDTFSHSVIERDIYSYTPNISCEFHELSDISVYCSKSIVTRYGYMLCDNCCPDLGITLNPGFHVPEKSKVAADSRLSSKPSSVFGSQDVLSATTGNNVVSSLSSEVYDANYPPLGGSSRSNASSVVSFASMKSVRGGGARGLSRMEQSGATTASRLERTFKALALNESAKRDHTDLQFPARGCYQQNNN